MWSGPTPRDGEAETHTYATRAITTSPDKIKREIADRLEWERREEEAEFHDELRMRRGE